MKLGTRLRIWSIATVISALVITGFDQNLTVALAQSIPKPAPTLPANYRQSMAQYVRAHWPSSRPIRDGKISQPHARAAGVFSSNTVSAVCAVLYRDNPLGQVVTENFVMTIENGRVVELPRVNFDICPGFSTFHEVLR